MNLLQMSAAGGVLILAVIVLRTLALNRLPKGTFLALWAVALVRLIVPFSIPSPVSVYTLAKPVMETLTDRSLTAEPAMTVPTVLPTTDFVPSAGPAAPAVPSPAPAAGTPVTIWLLVWLAGAALCGAFFLFSYLRCRREFRTALPVDDEQLQIWLAGNRLRRPISIRQSDRVHAPLTYGLLRPVILLPRNWQNESQLSYVLEHELAHIRHLDALWKPILALTACVHWFNPLVWCMFTLANRDMELRCDEAVVRRLGLDRRSGYALTLISMEEKKSGLGPFASAFSRNAIEERITAIMKLRKRSIAAIIAAVVLVCCVGAGFATSAAGKTDAPYPQVQDGTFTKKELNRLASLWFEGYGDMTVAAYQQKMWTEFDTPEDIALIDRYGQYSVPDSYPDGLDAETSFTPFITFDAYFHYVFEPLTAHNWQERTFSGTVQAQTNDGSPVLLEYDFTMHILDPDALTVSDYQKRLFFTKACTEKVLSLNVPDQRIYGMLSSAAPQDEALEITTRYSYTPLDAGQLTDAGLHAQSSRETANQWDRLLTPYTAFGLTYQFDDPDLDGNGLTMWWGGKEVRGIYDDHENIWLTEHAGPGFSEGAVELYTVYTDGVLSGLREAAPDEQADFDQIRQNNRAALDSLSAETREFPRAALEDYDALMTLRTFEPENLPLWASYPYPDARDLSLEDFNQRLLDWANENPGAWDRINCDVIWNDFDKELTSDAKSFAAVTCWLSGTENGQMIRALHTGEPEQDPHFSRSMPMRSNEESGIVNGWCDLYYDLSYHITDKSKVTVQERDACVGGMMNAVSTFWQDTDFDTLLQMTEADVVAEFNAWAAEVSTENVRINPITADDIHFQPYDERGIN